MDGGDERLPGAPVRRSSRPEAHPRTGAAHQTKVTPATSKVSKLL